MFGLVEVYTSWVCGYYWDVLSLSIDFLILMESYHISFLFILQSCNHSNHINLKKSMFCFYQLSNV